MALCTVCGSSLAFEAASLSFSTIVWNANKWASAWLLQACSYLSSVFVSASTVSCRSATCHMLGIFASFVAHSWCISQFFNVTVTRSYVVIDLRKYNLKIHYGRMLSETAVHVDDPLSSSIPCTESTRLWTGVINEHGKHWLNVNAGKLFVVLNNTNTAVSRPSCKLQGGLMHIFWLLVAFKLQSCFLPIFVQDFMFLYLSFSSW